MEKRRPGKMFQRSGAWTAILVTAFFIAIILVGIFSVSGQTVPTANANVNARLQSLAAGTLSTEQVPTTLPAGGVTINQQFVLKPLTATQQSLVKLTKAQAIAIGRTYANARPFAAQALLASFTSIDSVPPPGTHEPAHVIKDVPAWIVTFTSDNPQDVLQGKKPAPGQTATAFKAKHFTIVLDVSTGAFIQGFFTA